MRVRTPFAARLGALAVAPAALLALAGPAMAADDCPNGGTVRFGVEPYEAAARLVPVYENLGKLIADKLGCKVEIQVTTSYNAEIEAMRAGKLEIGEFGPLGYVLAHQVAKAEAVASFSDKEGKPDTYTASIVTWPGSGITALKDVAGHSFAFSDPASTSGHLFPAYGLRKAAIDPDKDVKPVYAGSHTASFEALRNHKVEAGELNSDQIHSAKSQGMWQDGMFTTLWQSDPIPQDPIAVRGDLAPAFKARVTKILQTLDLHSLPPKDLDILAGSGKTLVPTTDAAYSGIRDLVKTLNIDLAKL
ncbi:putative selenate ABC transporter substrate-binding protein [Aliidongia dinghuensis]|uniref:Putative selenate ABC transporter substrate-binding protein n=1 Tax=Aliidongia dinghuensis TaxID=1867774 RepID=A0A8J2YVQ9_9PROT|nr:phosphate/phosphite/phosphonate ABC transporter substrate-binding protein [Aliidongia dinghuensis]GGF29273.1 putative selenate ABC transporter substrate-binding protein [Aliidongia dinghuensis]